jgi:hypothetical protein
MPARVSDFAALQRRKCSAINRHNQQLFEQLVNAQQDRGRHGKTERLGGLAVINSRGLYYGAGGRLM